MALSSKQTVAKNTILLYVRTFIVLIISLVTSRILLQSLGVEDYGIYNAVGGFVAMFAVLTGSMSAAISRYITFELGTGNCEKLKQVFSSSVIVQLIFIAVIILVAEAFGIWFLNEKMTIPADRMIAANWVFQCTVVIFCVNLLSVPYNAEIIAHEHMKTYAYVSIVDNVFRLIIAYLIFISPLDKLIFYALLMTALSVGIRVFYQIYCTKRFEECKKISFKINRSVLKGLVGFASWNMLGEMASIFSHQGISLVLNVFLGPLVNAAYGVANQVNSAVLAFTNNFTTALSPSITKSYAEGSLVYMKNLVLQGARYSYYLLLILVVPLLIETETVLHIWLKDVPAHSVIFVKLMLVYSLISILSQTTIRAVQATGDIKRYQIIISTVSLLSLPLAYILLRFGFAPESALIAVLVVSFCTLIVRLIIVKPMIGISIGEFAENVLLRCVLVSIFAFSAPYALHIIMPKSLIVTVIICFVSVLWTAGMCCFIGMSKAERNTFYSKTISIIKKKRKNSESDYE
ncbi:MAG: oligosaccharide flippase family protein [Bacteroidales bacterium]|nr:oligosaccharide flippase family protein [Candidatus Cacconaster scatequi]